MEVSEPYEVGPLHCSTVAPGDREHFLAQEGVRSKSSIPPCQHAVGPENQGTVSFKDGLLHTGTSQWALALLMGTSQWDLT